MFTILIVDGDGRFLSEFRRNASSWPGVEIRTVPGIKEAMELLKDNSCDTVVSEYLLPDGNGIDLLRYIRSRYGDIPFIFLTSHGSEEIAAEGSRFGISGYIIKKEDSVPLFSEIYGKIRNEMQRKKAVDALRERETRCRTILESQPGLICRLGPDLELTYANRVFLTYFGTAGSERTGTWFYDYILEDDRQSLSNAFRQLTPGSPSVIVETRIRPTSGGSNIPALVEWTFTAAFDEMDRPVRIHGSGKDVSYERERAAEHERQLENLVFLSRTAMEFVDMKDTDDIFLYIAENLRRLLPTHTTISVHSQDSVTRTSKIETIIADDDVISAFREWFGSDLVGTRFPLDEETFSEVAFNQKGISEAPPLYYFLMRVFSEDACKHVEEVCSFGKGYVIAFSSQGQAFGNICFILGKGATIGNPDLLEAFANQASVALLRWKARKAAEEEIARVHAGLEQAVADRTAELLAANRNLESFSYSVSHDLRAPLRSIEGFSSILLNQYGKALPPDGIQLVEKVRQNTRRMSQLIDDILEFSRSGLKELNKKEVDVQVIVREILDELAASRTRDGIDAAIGDLPPCQVDPALIRQVFQNLLSNAFKFSRCRDVARIEVGSYKEDGHPVYYVRDNGIGFDMKYRDRLFRVFERLHDGREFEGTGIGLAIVDQIVRRHGGHVWAESEIDQGSTFYFTIGRSVKTITGISPAKIY